MEIKKNMGLIHYYYGMGNGKTSILLGHVVRAVGWKLNVLVIQFLKKHNPNKEKWFYMGEYVTLEEKLGVDILQYGGYEFVRKKEQIQAKKAIMEKAFCKMKEVLSSHKYDLVLLDELPTAVKLGFFDKERMINLLENRQEKIEVLIAGREKFQDFINIADYCVHLEEI